MNDETSLKANQTAAQVLARQKADHDKPNGGSTAVAVADSDAAIDAYVMEHCGGGGATHFRFAKDSKYRKISDDAEIPVGTEFVVIYDQIQVGLIRFNGKGNAPTRHMGPLFADFMPPVRDTLGDLDKSLWVPGLDGQPQDPWKNQILLPLVDPKTSEHYIFNTTSVTGRGAVGKLIAHCKRLRRTDPGFYPVVKLDLGGFIPRRDPRIGWVPTPHFTVVGTAPKDGSVPPDTSIAGDLNDELPW